MEQYAIGGHSRLHRFYTRALGNLEGFLVAIQSRGVGGGASNLMDMVVEGYVTISMLSFEPKSFIS
jgi:hypothetical protein